MAVADTPGYAPRSLLNPREGMEKEQGAEAIARNPR